MTESEWWTSIVPQMNDKTICEIVDWANDAKCVWWIKLVEVDLFPSFELIFHLHKPVTKFFILIDLHWNEHFSPLEIDMSSYAKLRQFKTHGKCWTNHNSTRASKAFDVVMNSLPNGKVHVIFSHFSNTATMKVQEVLRKQKAYVIQMTPQDDPGPIVQSIRHLSYLRHIVIIHSFSSMNVGLKHCVLWYINQQNKITSYHYT